MANKTGFILRQWPRMCPYFAKLIFRKALGLGSMPQNTILGGPLTESTTVFRMMVVIGTHQNNPLTRADDISAFVSSRMPVRIPPILSADALRLVGHLRPHTPNPHLAMSELLY